MQSNRYYLDIAKKELDKYRSTLTANEMQDVTNLSLKLMDKEVIDRHLKELETKLYNNAKLKNIFNDANLSSLLLNYKNKNTFKILSDVLYLWANENGFGMQFAKLTRALSPSMFYSVLSSGCLFKDIGVPPEHGAWTHFLQWYILVEENKLNPFLISSPKELYTMLGTAKGVLKDKNQKEISVWGIILDRPTSKESYDFRAPDNLHKYIKESLLKFPILSIIIAKGFSTKYISTLEEAYPSIQYRDKSDRAKQIVRAK